MALSAGDGVEDGKAAGKKVAADDDNNGLPPSQANCQERRARLVGTDVDQDQEPKLKVL